MVAERIEVARQHHLQHRIKDQREHDDAAEPEQAALERAAVCAGAGEARKVGGVELGRVAADRLAGQRTREGGHAGVVRLGGELEGVDEARAQRGGAGLEMARDALGGIAPPPDPMGEHAGQRERGAEAEREHGEARGEAEPEKRVERAGREHGAGEKRQRAP